MTRLKAALIHLGISSAALLLLAAITLFYWYPNPHYKYEGVLTILGLITLVDVVLGPMFTFIVFKQGKPSLKFDLTVIAVIQIAAFVYGTHIIHSQHPEFITYVDGTMFTIPASAIDEQQIEEYVLKRRIHIGPKLAVSSLPDDPKVVTEFTIAQFTKNKTLADSPEFYRSYPPQLTELAEKTLDIKKLLNNPESKLEIDNFLATEHLSQGDIYLLKLVNNLRNSIIVLDKKSGLPVGYLDIRP